MEFHQIELFLAVMEHCGITKAAEKVHLSPGAVSLQMTSLARELRTDLFIRSGKRLAPTPDALRFLDHAKHLARRMRDIERGFENNPAADARAFHFATGATTLIHLLGPPLRQLRKQFFNTAIQVTVSATEAMAAGLLNGRFDLALISLPFAEEQLKTIPLFEEELLILRPSPRRSRSWHVGTLKARELAGAPFLLYPKTSNMRTMIDAFLNEIGIDPAVITEAGDTEAIKRMVESGLGYSILPEFALRGQPRFFDVLRVAGHRLARIQALAMAPSEHSRALTVSIAEFLETALADTPARIRRGRQASGRQL